jgi:hypothetical protein
MGYFRFFGVLIIWILSGRKGNLLDISKFENRLREAYLGLFFILIVMVAVIFFIRII